MYCEHFFELNFQAGMNGRTAQLTDGQRASIKYFGQSSFAHYAVAGNRNVVKVRKDFPLKLLGPLGCSIQTGAGTVMNGLRPQPGSSIAVLGAGAVGRAAILGSVVSGCATIIAVDRNDFRLELANRLGATHAINTTREPDLGKAIRAVAPRGVNFVVDAAGVVVIGEVIGTGKGAGASNVHAAKVLQRLQQMIRYRACVSAELMRSLRRRSLARQTARTLSRLQRRCQVGLAVPSSNHPWRNGRPNGR